MDANATKTGVSGPDVLEAMRRDVGKESEPGDWLVIDQPLIDAYVAETIAAAKVRKNLENLQ